MGDALKVGDTVRYSAAAIRELRPRDPNRSGIVLKMRYEVPLIRWSDRKTPTYWLPDLIEKVPEEPLPPDVAARFAHVEITDA